MKHLAGMQTFKLAKLHELIKIYKNNYPKFTRFTKNTRIQRVPRIIINYLICKYLQELFSFVWERPLGTRS